MRLFGLSATLLATFCLTACNNAPQPGPGGHRGGRYLGIGTYPAGRMWSRMVAAGPAADRAAATIADDEQIIVTVDSNTGEVRQCGNLTGHCIGMNPWTGVLGRGQAAPISVSEHAADADAAASVANTAEPVRPARR
jgi:hypothetical protein